MAEYERRRKVVQLNCPVCQAQIEGSETMREHLITEHEIGKRQAGFLVKKMVEWKQESLDPDLFPRTPGRWDGPEIRRSRRG